MTDRFAWRARIKHEPWEGPEAIKLWLWRNNMDNSIEFASPVVLEKHADRHALIDPPPFIGRAPGGDFGRGHEHREMIQAIVDAAHEAGFRPKGMESVTNQLAATTRHLEDMRAIVSRTIACPLPGIEQAGAELNMRGQRPGGERP